MRFTLRVKMFVLFGVLLFPHTAAYADTHWVNLSGSNEAPYTFYSTGAHEIQDGIDAAMAEDTVRIAAGIYHPDTTIFLKDSIAVIGAGRDSTMIAPNSDDFRIIFKILGPLDGAGGGITISGLMISGYDSPKKNYPFQVGIYIHLKRAVQNFIIGNGFHYCDDALQLSNANIVVAHNSFDSNYIAINIAFDGPFDIHHNEVQGWPLGGGEPSALGVYGSVFPLLGPTKIHHNTVFTHRGAGVQVRSIDDSVLVYNNLFVTSESMALFNNCAGCNGAVIRNNTIVRTVSDPGKRIAGFTVTFGGETVVENNAFIGGEGVVRLAGLYGGGQIRLAYNDLWGLETGTNGVFGLQWDDEVDLDTVGNLAYDPMFTGDTTFRLQRGSPLIDTGNPDLSDADSSRSDIGWHGGPEGTTYEYPEEPPQPPDTLRGVSSDDSVYFSWPSSTEADLAGYRLYRDLFSGFVPHAGNLLASVAVPETTYIDGIKDINDDLYYVLIAMDTTGLESPPSNEVAHLSTGILGGDEYHDQVPRTPYIAGNYPNPFNTSTNIEYFIPDVGAPPTLVELIVYDALGRKVATLVNGRQYPGNHQASWNGRNDSGDPVSSGVYFARLTLWGYEFASSTKLVLQK